MARMRWPAWSRREQPAPPDRQREPSGERRPSVSPCSGSRRRACSRSPRRLEADYDCLVFHATGIGGQSMEKLVDSGMLTAVIDITTTEVCDLLMGGVFPATEDRFGAMIRAGMPYVGACGALDMVNFGAAGHGAGTLSGQTVLRTQPASDADAHDGRGKRAHGPLDRRALNPMDAPVRFFLPEGGVSALDAPGQPFHDPAADAALFDALERTVRQTAARQLVRLPHNINDPAFAALVVEAFRRCMAAATGAAGEETNNGPVSNAQHLSKNSAP